MDEIVIPETLTAPVTNLPATTVLPKGWSISKVAALVRDLAMNLYDEATILTNHGLTAAQFALLKTNEHYQRALEQAVSEWNSPQSTTKRLSFESAAAIEDALPTIASRLSKTTEPLSDVVSLLKTLSEMAGITGAKATGQQAVIGERFKIVINLGADVIKRETSSPIVIDHSPDHGA
jgi:hypothetical protein